MNKTLPPRSLLLAGAAIAFIALIALLVPLLTRHTFSGTVLEPPQQAYDFTLPSTLGRPLALSELKGKLVLLFFGYTYCPDVCPATLGNLKMALGRLGSKADGVRVMFVSVDPPRDTVEHLMKYLTSFDPQRMIGLSGDQEQTRQIAYNFGIFFEKRPADSEGRYLVDHSALVLLIDTKGVTREIFPFGTTPEGFAGDIEYFLK